MELGRQSSVEDGDGLKYDAFVSYNAQDRDFVHEYLLPAVEDGDGGTRVCVHERDFAVGRTIIENIVTCLEASRTCIVVMSKDYARSEWCR